MKKLLVSVLAIAGLVACSQEQTLVQSNNSGTLMEFNVAALDNATRLDPSITSTTLDAFDIWAYVDSKAGTVLTEERVSRNGDMWSYVNKQYWTPKHTYYFDAIAPVDTDNWAYDQANDTIAFTNVEGTEDLIYAHEVVTTPEELGQSMDAVGLEFNHLLSKVKFTFKNGFTTDNVYVAVENVEMVVPAAGTYTTTSGAWALENGTTTLAFGNVTDGDTLDIEGTTVFAAQKSVRAADERFTIPAGAGQNYVVTFTVKHYNGNVCLSTSDKTVNISGLSLENGKAYNFVTEINEQNAADAALLPIEFEVECVNDWNHTDVDSAEAFANALKAETSSIHVTLTEDIDVAISSLGTITGGSGEYKLGGEGTEAITIDLNGHKLNITTTYWSVLGAKNADAVFTIKNGTMTSSQATGTWNSYDLGFANCNYNFEDVVFEKAIALEAANKTYNLKNVTINETHDYYAMWVSAKGQTVNIDGLTINSLGRGIKIDEQYVGAPAKVTMNVANATFTTAKKAAVIVKSVAGAEINWGAGNNIANVAEDDTFAVWVDEDAAAYADKVVVNGAMVKVEGWVSAATSQEVLDNLKDGGSVCLTDDVTSSSILKVNGGGLLDGMGYTLTANGVDPYESFVAVCEGTLQNVTVKGAYRALGTGGSGSYPMTGDAYFYNVVTEGATYGFNISYGNGHKIYVDNCVIGDWNSYSGLSGAEFTNCTFIAQGNYKAAQRVYGNVTFTYENCIFPAEDPYDYKKYNLSGKEGKPTLVFKNCKMSDGTVLTKDNFTTYFGGSSLSYKVINE